MKIEKNVAVGKFSYGLIGWFQTASLKCNNISGNWNGINKRCIFEL